jgi:cold shock CspA family protein
MIGQIKSVQLIHTVQLDGSGRKCVTCGFPARANGDSHGGFFFIHADEPGLGHAERFAHRTALQDIELSQDLVGLLVEYTPAMHPKGLRAVQVRLVTQIGGGVGPAMQTASDLSPTE